MDLLSLSRSAKNIGLKNTSRNFEGSDGNKWRKSSSANFFPILRLASSIAFPLGSNPLLLVAEREKSSLSRSLILHIKSMQRVYRFSQFNRFQV